MPTPNPQPHAERGSFIIEAIISLLLFAVGLISLLGLSVQALNQVSQSKARNDASYIAGELIAEMWVASSVNLSNWNDRLQAVVPGATGTVYLSTCDCVETSGTNACAGAASGTITVANPQPVTVCISWTDRKDPDAPRRYQASSMISRNT